MSIEKINRPLTAAAAARAAEHREVLERMAGKEKTEAEEKEAALKQAGREYQEVSAKIAELEETYESNVEEGAHEEDTLKRQSLTEAGREMKQELDAAMQRKEELGKIVEEMGGNPQLYDKYLVKNHGQ